MERLGFHVNSKEIVKKIQHYSENNKDIKFYKRQSLSRTAWVYHNESDNRDYRVIYDKNRKEIITIFPHNDRKKEIRNGVQNRLVQSS